MRRNKNHLYFYLYLYLCKVRASNETRSSLASTNNGEAINSALRANPMIELVDLRSNSKENPGSRSSRMLPPKSGSACASSRENVVSSKKKSVRASTMSSLRELEQLPKPPVMPSRDRSWGRSQQPLSRGSFLFLFKYLYFYMYLYLYLYLLFDLCSASLQ